MTTDPTTVVNAETAGGYNLTVVRVTEAVYNATVIDPDDRVLFIAALCPSPAAAIESACTYLVGSGLRAVASALRVMAEAELAK